MILRIVILVGTFSLLYPQGCSNKEAEATLEKSKFEPNHDVAEVITVTTRPNTVPNFTWKDPSGKIVDFDSFRGKITLINFWATWCGPCKRELPDLVALSNALAPRGVKFIGISVDRGANVVETVRSYIGQYKIPYQNVIANGELEEAFGNIRAIPTSFIIDANGRIVQTIVGMRTKEFFAQAINRLL
ncbi:MAG: TlpA family protein disulfide reductase [Ignavibacteriae bacterium]|nr:TlpA family protein disulfide reductase [Ignavibacteriota bacterium]